MVFNLSVRSSYDDESVYSGFGEKYAPVSSTSLVDSETQYSIPVQFRNHSGRRGHACSWVGHNGLLLF